MEKKLRRTLLLIALACGTGLYTACSKKNERSYRKQEVADEVTGQAAEVAGQSGWFDKTEGDSTWQTYWQNGKRYYESIWVLDKRVGNKFFPKIQDAFLFEDKFYLKATFPVAYAGEIQFTFPEYPDYTLNRIGEQAFQVVINDALDLNRVVFSLEYLPSENDSLEPTRYSFTHVVFQE
ncbi:hypothetical protein SAMN05192553_102505 [Cyclobacterium xiamenense]|uniref:Uncharacterized protein n=1 Tax=Cyclobacterium xiamenense TaxID=1297121 RepID=A0A1H6W5U9_9BACT|nr:hypothetical protein [Cyclobacterium xiamenense]SEJ12338.1 hypothetical protein SAMN05192553_102505 [Cyclobacterium xiamenense]